MQRLLDALVYSASDLNNYLACDHLLTLELGHAKGLLQRPKGDMDEQALMARKGLNHEEGFLKRLKAEGRTLVELTADWTSPGDALIETMDAMREGVDVIYQATFWDGQWRGMADFLLKVDRPSNLGPWSYEVLDTKMARNPKAYHLLQLCFYSDMLTKLQGSAPDRLHIALGTGETVSYRVSDFDAYYRHVKGRFTDWVANDTPFTQPYPVEHCGLCPWQPHCEQEWEAKDHLSRVANIRHSQILRLEEAGITTLAELAKATARPRGMAPATFETLRAQAQLQLHHREEGTHTYRLLPHEPSRGFALLPEPNAGDVFFDMEGDPYMEGGLEYLFGVVYQEDDAWPFKAFWAHSRHEERKAFEAFVDFVIARREAYPGMHVYHYAAYEETALKRLACQHGTREEEVDTLLREGVLVDLYRVVRQGLRVSQPSYSIKKLEAFYMEAREADVKNAGASIVAYEKWLETKNDEILDDIGRYNEEDCVSTRLLRDWLLDLRAELEGRLGAPLPWPVPIEDERTEESLEAREERNQLAEALTRELPEDLETATPAERARQLLADLLDYHQREDKPLWWSFFHHCAMTAEELMADGEALGGLVPDGEGPVRQEKLSTVWRLCFEAQDHKLKVGDSPRDPATGRTAGTIVELDESEGWLEIKRGPSLDGQPLPQGLFPFQQVPNKDQRKALRRLAEAVVAGGMEGDGPYRALRDLMMRVHPRVSGRVMGDRLQGDTLPLSDILAIASNLDESTLMIQGPPGAGKTFSGARMIVELLKQGRRIGIAATSHKAIHNLLAEVEAAAEEAGVSFRGLKKCSGSNPETKFESATGAIVSKDKADFNDPAFQLIAGTAWLFSRADLDGTLDYLVLDEAGQISLADALAMGTSARNLILLGDPQQLPHVAQGIHPRGSGGSVLTHLLGDADTIPADRGLFLDRSWRMHPSITHFISELSYENRLLAAAGCEHQRLDAGDLGPSGLRYLPVVHQGNGQSSREEAGAIEGLIERLLAGSYTNKNGESRPLTSDDILVVAPYNLQVELLRRMLPPSIRVGTVDKFQGQEAPVVIFSMATSSGEELPRNLEFLFNRNRLNVAISRAKCLAVLVASPALLDVRCQTVDQMRLVNALCRFVEVARDHQTGA